MTPGAGCPLATVLSSVLASCPLLRPLDRLARRSRGSPSTMVRLVREQVVPMLYFLVRPRGLRRRIHFSLPVAQPALTILPQHQQIGTVTLRTGCNFVVDSGRC